MDILYHYCPTQSFTSIINSHSIWLSSLSLSNDAMEGRLVTSTLVRLAQHDGLDTNEVIRLQEFASKIERMHEGIGFCLSEDGDILSQWRGYANDATGVSIGFSVPYLRTLLTPAGIEGTPPITLQKVAYTHDEHDAHVRPTYLEIRKHIGEGAFNKQLAWGLSFPHRQTELVSESTKRERVLNALIMEMLGIVSELYVLKADAFHEESEWRLISFLNNYLTITPQLLDDYQFRERGNVVIPYRKIALQHDKDQPIVDVILGPNLNISRYRHCMVG